MKASHIRSFYHSPRSIWITKMVFRIICVVFSVAIIVICAVLSTTSSSQASAYLVPPSVVSFIIGNTDIVCILRRQGHFGVNPIAGIIVDLALMVGYTMGAVGFIHSRRTPRYYTSSDHSQAVSLSLNITGFAMAGIQLASHFALFVISCYETDLRYRVQPKAKASAEAAAVSEQGIVLCYNCQQPVATAAYRKEPPSPSSDEKHSVI